MKALGFYFGKAVLIQTMVLRLMVCAHYFYVFIYIFWFWLQNSSLKTQKTTFSIESLFLLKFV